MRRLTLLLAAAAAAAPLAALAPARPLGDAPIPFATIDEGTFSGWPHGKVDLVVQRPRQWLALWKDHTSNQFPPPPAPAIDFATETVFAVFLGGMPTSGYEIEIVAIETNGAQVDVFVTETVPGAGCATLDVLTHPFHFVRLPKTTLPVVFHHVEVAAPPC